MNKKILVPTFAIIAIVIVIAVITSNSKKDGVTSKVRIAVNMPLTGPITAWSGDYPVGFKMGLEDACRELGIDPTVFEADFQDNAGKPSQAASIIQKQLVSGFEVYMCGTSEAAKAVVDQVDQTTVPNFLLAFDPFLAAANPNRLRILPNSKIEAPVFIAYAKQRKSKSVSIIHVDSAYATEEFQKIVAPALKAEGMNVTIETFPFSTSDYKSIALKTAQLNPDLIFVCGYSFHLRPLIGDLRTNGLVRDGRVMAVMDALDFVADGTDKTVLDGMVFASPFFDIPGVANKSEVWRTKFKQKFGRDPSYVPAYAYDNAWALVLAYKKSGSVTTQAIRAAMPFEGVTGQINLDKDGDIVSGVGLAKIGANGKIEGIAQ